MTPASPRSLDAHMVSVLDGVIETGNGVAGEMSWHLSQK